jgi:glycosyltransferase involved in cell wall biosynthesis
VPYPARDQPYGAGLRDAVRQLRAGGGSAAWDAVHVQGLGLWPAAEAARHGTPRPWIVLDLYDVPVVARQRLLALRPRPWNTLLVSGLRRQQARVVRAASAIIVASEHDAGVLRRLHPAVDLPIVVVPNGVDRAYWRQRPAGIEPEPATLLFPGGLNYPPNIDAARVLVHDVLPRVRARVPQARVLLAGRAPAPAVAALARANPAVTLCDDPPDMRPLLARATLVAVPLRAGSGTRLKILQALAAGRPVVSTPLGAEGLDLAPGPHVAIAPLIEPFVNEVVRLLRHPMTGVLEGYDWTETLQAIRRVYPDA